jgi:hypothetical protein
MWPSVTTHYNSRVYATCLFCNSALGANDVIEHFPVGRRLAYDAAHGRLWVVCQTCERWNLSPIEMRWEAIEEAERAFRGTRVRVSSDNIGLARLRDDTELVRIGQPPRIELAVWRYGDQFDKRHRRTMRTVGVTAAASIASAAFMGSQFWAGVAVLGSAASLLNIAVNVSTLVQRWKRENKIRTTVCDENGATIAVTESAAREISFVTGGPELDWKLKVPRHATRTAGPLARALGVKERIHRTNECVYLRGEHASRVLAKVLPHVNSEGAGKRRVQDAMDIVTEAQNLQQLLQKASTSKRPSRSEYMDDGTAPLGAMPAPMRLALEMSLHEEDERRAMDGELHLLEQRWREADAIAKIADALLLPSSIDEQLSAIKEGGPRR